MYLVDPTLTKPKLTYNLIADTFPSSTNRMSSDTPGSF